MNTNKRIGSVVPCEDVDPHTGSFLTYGVIIGWIDNQGNPTTRKKANRALIELSGRKFSDWDDWAESYAWKLEPFGEEQ